MKHRTLTLFLLCACVPKVSEHVEYRCHDVDPGVIWAAAYAAHYVDPTGHGAKEAVRLANQATANWEDHCARVTETSTVPVRGGYTAGGVLR